MASVTDVLADCLPAVICGKSRIHKGPAFAVKLNDLINPAFFLQVNAYPCVVCFPRISDFQPGRNRLGAEHGGHQRGIIETYARLIF